MEATIQIPSEMYEARGNRVLGLTIVEQVDFQSWLVNSDITHKLLRLIGKIGFVNSQKSIKGFVHLLILSLSNKEYFVLSLLIAKYCVSRSKFIRIMKLWREKKPILMNVK
jgi:hypothetical protein